MEVRQFEAKVHGRALVVQRPSRRAVVGFHGYGETAEQHLKELEQIPGIDGWTVVAVQALHPFYTRAGEIVASWMTSLDRDQAIADNIAYAREVVSSLGELDRLVFCGFSQGAAMAYRAAASMLGRTAGALILGGDVPPDVAGVAAWPPILIGRGRRDDWFTAEKLKKDLKVLGASQVEVLEFDGGHEWTESFRAAAGEFLLRLG